MPQDRDVRIPEIDTPTSSDDAMTSGAEAATPVVAPAQEEALSSAEERLKTLDAAERAIDASFKTGKADRAVITASAQDDAREAVRLVGTAIESDEMADDAARITAIAVRNADRDGVKAAKKRERETRKQAKYDHREATRAARKAYDAIRFSAPNKLGFLRVIQFAFAFHIIATLLGLLVTSRDAIQYTSNTLFDWAMIMLEGVALWFIMNRYKIARPFTIVVGGIGIAYHLAYAAFTGSFRPLEVLGNCFFYLVLILYFALSKRVRAQCVNEFGSGAAEYHKEDFVIDRRSFGFYRNLVMYFVIFSVFGHWMEAGFCQLIRLGLVSGEYDPSNTMLWRDWLYPFPMEGAAVVIIGLFLYPFKEWLDKKFPFPLPYVISFLVNMLTCSLIEFSMGLIVNADHQLWDYSNEFGNIMGQVCLQNAVGFGVAASVITWFIYPMMERWIARAPEHIVNVAFVVIAVFGGILWSLYLFDPPAPGGGVAGAIGDAAQEQKMTEERSSALAGAITSAIALDEIQKQVDNDPSLTAEQRQRANAKIDEARMALLDAADILTEEGAPATSAPATAAPTTAAPEAPAPEAAPEEAAPEAAPEASAQDAAPEQLSAAA